MPFLHRPALRTPLSCSQHELVKQARHPSRWILEISHLVQMLDMKASRLSAAAPPFLTPTTDERRGSRSRRPSFARFRSAGSGAGKGNGEVVQPGDPGCKFTIDDAITADVACLMTFGIEQVDRGRVGEFLG
ncbi:MAG: hypothetical protein Q9191_008563, partial [Dirinaria sp. TL-2023a]